MSAIRQLVELNASDLHLVVNDPPMLRVDGKLQPAKGLSVWNKDHTFAAVQTMTNDLELERFKDDLELDISFSIGDLLRFRVNVYRDRLGICAALRTIPTEIKTAKQLDLDPRIADLAMLPRGLVLVCGPTGSGKSTTLAAIVDKANAERADHIITIEDPIEFVHQHKRCVMSQREVGTDTKSFAEALKRALREDPDIIEVGELRDLETISTALTAVETGHLVFATLHTQDAGSTVDRLIDVYPENQQQQIRVQVASTLRAVVVQTLLPRASGHGRVARHRSDAQHARRRRADPRRQSAPDSHRAAVRREGRHAHARSGSGATGEQGRDHIRGRAGEGAGTRGVREALRRAQVVLRMAGTAGAMVCPCIQWRFRNMEYDGTAMVHARPRNNRKVTQQSLVFRTQRETGNMSSATVAATDNRTRCDAIRHWLSPHRLHCIVLAAYVIVVATVMCFHEPWFDEAQAWLIARDCSWREMILERPHYEGHPHCGG